MQIQYGYKRLEAFSLSTLALSSPHYHFSSISSTGYGNELRLKQSYHREIKDT